MTYFYTFHTNLPVLVKFLKFYAPLKLFYKNKKGGTRDSKGNDLNAQNSDLGVRKALISRH